MNKLTDTDPMPFGKHKGELMQDVPAHYLAWLKDEGCNHMAVSKYIEENWTYILQELPDRIK